MCRVSLDLYMVINTFWLTLEITQTDRITGHPTFHTVRAVRANPSVSAVRDGAVSAPITDAADGTGRAAVPG